MKKIIKSPNLLEHYELILQLWNNYIDPSILNQWQTLHFIYAQGLHPFMNLLLKSTNWESLKTLGHATSKVKKFDKKRFLYFIITFNDLKVSMFCKIHLLTKK